jgi:hypothetical protein
MPVLVVVLILHLATTLISHAHKVLRQFSHVQTHLTLASTAVEVLQLQPCFTLELTSGFTNRFHGAGLHNLRLLLELLVQGHLVEL